MPALRALALRAFLSLLFFSYPVRAMADESSSPSAASPTLTSPAPAPAPSFVRCRLGEHSGIEEADAQTAARLVCSEIERAGPSPGSSFEVDVERLGSVVILAVKCERAPGAPPDGREVRVDRIEDVASAAPRIATAIVHGTPVEDIEPMKTLLPSEPPSNPMKLRFALGMLGRIPPLERGAFPAPGAEVEYSVALDPIEFVAGFRGGGDSGNAGVTMTFLAFSLGSRYFIGRADTSPFLGAGFAWSYQTLDEHSGSFAGSHSGLGAYVEAGVALFRTHHTNLELGARVDFPFYSLTTRVISVSEDVAVDGTQTVSPDSNALYYVPVSLELRVRF